MGCNCKANDHIMRIKRRYGYNPPTKGNVKVSAKIAMVAKAILIWVVLIAFTPITLGVMVVKKLTGKPFRFREKIKIRL